VQHNRRSSISSSVQGTPEFFSLRFAPNAIASFPVRSKHACDQGVRNWGHSADRCLRATGWEQPTGTPDPNAALGIDPPNPEMVLLSCEARVVANIQERLPVEGGILKAFGRSHFSIARSGTPQFFRSTPKFLHLTKSSDTSRGKLAPATLLLVVNRRRFHRLSVRVRAF
jgi:hypothetical protein